MRKSLKNLSLLFSFLFALTISETKTNAHPVVVAFSAAHMVAAHVVATHTATMVGTHAVAAHAAAGAVQAGMGAHGAALAGQAVFIHGATLHCVAAPCIASHLPVHGSMLSYAQGATGAAHFAHMGASAGGFAHLSGHGSMLSSAQGAVRDPMSASQSFSHFGSPAGATVRLGQAPVSPGSAASFGASPGSAVSYNYPTQIGYQGFGDFSIHSQRTAQTYIGSAYYTRFRTYPTKSLYGISQYYGQGSPYAGASTYGTYNSGDLFMGRGGYLPYANYSPGSVGSFPTGYGIGGVSNSGITSSTFNSGVIPGYAGYGAPGYSRLATGFGGNGIYPSSAAYSRYLANPGYPVYTGQAGSSIYPSLGATAYSPGVQYSSIYPGYGLYSGQSGSSVYTAINTGTYSSSGLPNNYISQAAQIRLFPTATNNYGYADTVFSSNSFVAGAQPNAFAGAYAAALPNTASGNFINSFTGLGLYNSL
jgi:hypothetical protein